VEITHSYEMGAKNGETFSVLEKITIITEKFYLRRACFFDLLNTTIEKKIGYVFHASTLLRQVLIPDGHDRFARAR